MRIFFVGPRQVAGFHILICYINVFSKPHKGLWRDVLPVRRNRKPAENAARRGKRPFMDGN